MSGGNQEAIAAWDGPIFDKYQRFRHIICDGLRKHGTALLEALPPKPSDLVLDVGCGLGDCTAEIAKHLTTGEAVGVDAAPRFIEAARRDYGTVPCTRYEVRDVQLDPLGGPYDRAFARFGTMFFDNPVAALRNVHRSLKPGALFTFTVWRKREDNPWVHAAEEIARELVTMPAEKSGPTCGPGPFSMQSPDLVSDQLIRAGFARPTFERFDTPILMGRDVDEALDFALALGPAGEIMRLGENAEAKRPIVIDALRRAFTSLERDGQIVGDSSAWLISARA